MSEHRQPSADLLWRLATNLKRLRKARGYTQHRLAQLCRLSPGYIGDVEAETVNITLANLEALARGLMCLEADLLMPIRETPRREARSSAKSASEQ